MKSYQIIVLMVMFLLIVFVACFCTHSDYKARCDKFSVTDDSEIIDDTISISRIDKIEQRVNNIDIPSVPLLEKEQQLLGYKAELIEIIKEAKEAQRSITFSKFAKYKVGDKVKIKTWKQMEEEYGISNSGRIPCNSYFTKSMEKKISKLKTDRVVTIKGVNSNDNCYYIEEMNGYWTNDMVEYLVSSNYIFKVKTKVIKNSSPQVKNPDKPTYAQILGITDEEKFASRVAEDVVADLFPNWEKKEGVWKKKASLITSLEDADPTIDPKVVKYLKDDTFELKEGMTKRQADAVWGKPNKVERGFVRDIPRTYWYYDLNGQRIRFDNGKIAWWAKEYSINKRIVTHSRAIVPQDYLDDSPNSLKKGMTKTQLYKLWGLPYEIDVACYNNKKIKTTWWYKTDDSLSHLARFENNKLVSWEDV